MTASLLANVEMAPKDPILGVTETYNADPNPKKVNLGVGVYYDDNSKVPVLKSVRAAEQKLAETAMPRNYLPIDGLAAYNKAVQAVVFGAESEAVQSGRILTVQTLGGTGGLKVGADLLRRLNPTAEAWISDPSWENHRALLEFAGSIMVISHDRWFLDRIATHILACEGDSQWVFFDGNYQEYEADKKKRLGEEGAKPKRMRYKALK